MDILLNNIHAVISKKNIKFLNISGIDNLLNAPLDPIFMGLMLSRDLKLVHKIVEKKIPSENVGLFLRKINDGEVSVQEYTVFPKALKEKTVVKEKNQILKYRNSHMLNFVIHSDIIQVFYNKALKAMKKAGKSDQKTIDTRYFFNKINFNKRWFQTYDSVNQRIIPKEKSPCIKTERFFMDCFSMVPGRLQGFIVVEREKEFAPIKSKANSKDTPTNAIKMMHNWAESLDQNIENKNYLAINNQKSDLVSELSLKEIETLLCDKKVFRVNSSLYENEIYKTKSIENENFYQILI